MAVDDQPLAATVSSSDSAAPCKSSGGNETQVCDKNSETNLASSKKSDLSKTKSDLTERGSVLLDDDVEQDSDLIDFDGARAFRRNELEALSHLSNPGPLQKALSSCFVTLSVPRYQDVSGVPPTVIDPDAPPPVLTPMETACQAGRLATVKALFETGRPELIGSADGPDRCNLSMTLAVDSGATDVVRYLLSKQVDANARGFCARPPLSAAIRESRDDIVEVLCHHDGTDLDARDMRDSTALHEAVGRRAVGLVKMLLDSKANPVMEDERGWSPILLAAHVGDFPAIELLVCAGAPVDGNIPRKMKTLPPDRRRLTLKTGREHVLAAGWTPLHLMLARGIASDIGQIIKWRADPCRKGGPENMTPLMLAVSFGHLEITKLLLLSEEVVAKIDSRDYRGRCAMHFAVMTPRPKASDSIVQILLEVHASPNIKNDNGQTPLDVTRNSGLSEHSPVVRRLQIEETVRLVMLRTKCRVQKRYEESEIIRNDLKMRGVVLEVQTERWVMPDGTWGYLGTDRARAQAQGGPGFFPDNC